MTAPIPPQIGPPVTPQVPTFRTLAIAASGLSAQRTRMDVIASNVANAETTRTPDGGPYRRRVVELEAVSARRFRSVLDIAHENEPVVPPITPPSLAQTAEQEAFGVRVKGITEDQTPGPRVYEPGHPDADADGYVTYPNVRVTDELVDLMDARQMYEALTSVFMVTKSIMRRSIDI